MTSALAVLEAGGIVVVNGDLVDRGRDQALVLLQHMILKILYPDQFFLTMGNHEVGGLAA
jgi:3',5'-cyclic AMP phosphodiesterase CpdA